MTSPGTRVGEPSLDREGVHANDGVFASVLQRLIVQDLLLDAAALVHGFHGAQNARRVR